MRGENGEEKEEDTTSCDATMKKFAKLNINKCLSDLGYILFLSFYLTLTYSFYLFFFILAFSNAQIHNVAERSYFAWSHFDAISLSHSLSIFFFFESPSRLKNCASVLHSFLGFFFIHSSFYYCSIAFRHV